MRRVTITYVNITLGTQYRTITDAQAVSEIVNPTSIGPWIPIIPGSQEGQDLDEQWQGEDED